MCWLWFLLRPRTQTKKVKKNKAKAVVTTAKPRLLQYPSAHPANPLETVPAAEAAAEAKLRVTPEAQAKAFPSEAAKGMAADQPGAVKVRVAVATKSMM